jgi:shikimate kinase
VRRVFLVGFMGAGKSTVGRLLARRLGTDFIDLDEEIERRAGMSISEVFATRGEQGFRGLEAETLAEVADGPAAIVACGGGCVARDESRALLANAGTAVVYLEVTAEEALARVGDTSDRPLLAVGDAPEAARTLLAARKALYGAVADVVVDTAGLTAEQVADAVVAALGASGDQT